MSKYYEEKDLERLITEEYAGLPGVSDSAMQKTIKTVINNTIKTLTEDDTSAPHTNTADIHDYTPVVISLIRRTLPTLVGPQLVGMQAMNLPTGRIFVQRVYGLNTTSGSRTELWGNGAIGTDTSYGKAPDPALSGPYTTKTGESLGWKNYGTDKDSTIAKYNEVQFGIEHMDVSVKTRALKGRITTEVMQDLRSVHGLDAEQELANILQTEITAEIDREIVSRIYAEAKKGATNCTTKGTFDFSLDADGRWSVEKVMGLLIQIEREATIIAQETRRGRGNFILTSPEVASYLSMANLISTQYQNTGFTPVVNPVGVSYYGVLANRFKVFVDPYMADTSDTSLTHNVIVGYKGSSVYDAGIFYCPYVPLQIFKAQGEEDFGQRIGIKSRYGLVSNPYSIEFTTAGYPSATQAADATNSFYRKFLVKF